MFDLDDKVTYENEDEMYKKFWHFAFSNMDRRDTVGDLFDRFDKIYRESDDYKKRGYQEFLKSQSA